MYMRDKNCFSDSCSAIITGYTLAPEPKPEPTVEEIINPYSDPDYESWTIIEKLDPGESTPSYSYDDDDDDEYL